MTEVDVSHCSSDMIPVTLTERNTTNPTVVNETNAKIHAGGKQCTNLERKRAKRH